MSSDDFVVLIVPWPNCCCTDVSRVPMPICVLVDVATEFAYMSAKFARPCLKPTVFAFAMLLPITSRWFAAPANPLKPC